MTQESQTFSSPLIDAIKRNMSMTMVVGIILIIMGVLALSAPLIAGASLAMMVGFLLLFGGISQVVFAFKAKSMLTGVLGVLAIIAGGYMVSNPGAALGALAFFLAIYLIASGIVESIIAFQVKPDDGWGFALFGGLLSVLLGLMIWSQFPLSGAWAIGILLGVKLLFSGVSLLMFALAARSSIKNLST